MLTGIDSAKEKFARAAIHLKAIKKAIAKYSASNPHEIIPDPNSEGVARVTEQPPIEISVLVGEVVYQIRSALDHLAFDLVKRNPHVASINPRWVEQCEFPLIRNTPNNQVPPLSENDFTRSLPGIPKEMFTFIEALQPYYRNETSFYLGLLAELSNIDKHRYLNLMGTRLSHKQRFETPRFNVSTSQAIDDGAELPPLPGPDPYGGMPVNVERSISAFVVFSEPTLRSGVKTLPIQDVLQPILHIAEGIILPAFEKFFQKP